MTKRGLGRGLDALIPSSAILGEDVSGEAIKNISVNEITPNSFQPRTEFDEDKIEELARSIKEHGVVQPIIVRFLNSGNYELVAGERRWRACQKLGFSEIPAVVKELDDRKLSEIALIENVQREDLNPLEEAAAYRRLLDDYRLTQEDLSRRLGKSRSFLANTLRLLSLHRDVQAYVRQGKLSAGHGKVLVGLEEDEQKKIVQKIISKNLSVRETESLVKKLSKKDLQEEKRTAAPSPRPLWIEEAEDLLRETLQARVQIKQHGQSRGKIIIDFYDEEDAERILEYFQKSTAF